MPRKALVVEDEQDTGLLLAEHLRRWGYEPTVLTDGTPAIPWVREHQPDLILLDLLLPGMDGFTICENLKLERQTNLIPIIMITSRTAEKHRNRAKELGVDVYLGKPYQEEELLRHLRELVSASA